MIARGFKPVVWVAAVGAAALGCYMLSLRVASERADSARLERRIVATQQQIRSLQTELGTRGRLAQLEHGMTRCWPCPRPLPASSSRARSSPASKPTKPPPLDGAADVRMASADTTSPAPQAAPAPARPPSRRRNARSRRRPRRRRRPHDAARQPSP